MEPQKEITCANCGERTTEYCSGLYCRACHKTESLESCLGDKQVNGIRALYGLSPMPRPNA